MADLGGFQSVASELAEVGPGIKVPGAPSMSQAITVPDNAMPVLPPPITSNPISSMPLFQDQNFTTPQLVVTPTTTLSSLSPIFEFFTTANQILSLDQAYIAVRAQINTYAGLDNGTFFPFRGSDGDQYIWPEGGIWSLLQNMTIQVNGVPLPNFQSGNVIAQLYTHPVIVPQTYDGGVATAYNTQIASRQGTMGTDQFFNRKKQGQIKPWVDFTGMTAGQASDTVSQTVYFRIPVKNLWTFYQQPGRLFTNDAKIRITFVLSGLEISATQVRSTPLSPYSGTLVVDTGKVEVPNTQLASQPVLVTLTDMYFVLPMYNTTEQMNHQTAAIVAERPLSFLMNNVEVYNSQFIQSLDLTVPGNWGKGPLRELIKGSGYLPKHWVICPTVTATWGTVVASGPVNTYPWGITGATWTRTCIMPGMIYARRIYLGGQPYYDDQVASFWGVSTYVSSIGGFTQAVEERARLMQQQGNYLEAPDQMWLNGYQNSTQLSAATNISAEWETQYGDPAARIGFATNLQAQKIALWAMGVGLNGMPLSQDPGLDTLADSRQQSFEVEYYTMPFWAGTYGGTPTATTAALPFTALDQVIYYNPTTAGAFLGVPTGVTMSLQHCLPYPMVVDYGRGRTTQYAYIQPMMESTTNVPM